MRLIDAEVLAERLLTAWDTADKEKKTEISAVISNVIIPILVGVPTAYDIDKVVEQLKELKAQDYDDSDEEPEWEDIENVYEDGRSQGRYEAYHRAIEIVKKGGAV